MPITYKKQFGVFVYGIPEKLNCIKNFVGMPLYSIGIFDTLQDSIELLEGIKQEGKDYLIQECYIARCTTNEPD